MKTWLKVNFGQQHQRYTLNRISGNPFVLNWIESQGAKPAKTSLRLIRMNGRWTLILKSIGPRSSLNVQHQFSQGLMDPSNAQNMKR